MSETFSLEKFERYMAAHRVWHPMIFRVNERHALGLPLDPADEVLMEQLGDEMDAAWYAMSKREQELASEASGLVNTFEAIQHVEAYLNRHPPEPHPHESQRGWAAGLSEWSRCAEEIKFLLTWLRRDNNLNEETTMGTLFDRWTKKKYTPPPPPPEKPAEEKIYNPLKARKGNGLKVSTLDDEDFNFRINDMRELKLDGITGDAALMADYDILARGDDGKEVRKRLRFVPVDDAAKGLTHNVLLLTFLTDFGYDKAYEDSLLSEEGGKSVGEPVLNEAGEVKVDGDGNQIMDVFKRVNELKTPWTASFKDLAASGQYLEHGSVTYWDFWRDTKDADGVDILEFYIIEMDGTKDRPASGQFKIWRGREIEQSRIRVV